MKTAEEIIDGYNKRYIPVVFTPFRKAMLLSLLLFGLLVMIAFFLGYVIIAVLSLNTWIFGVVLLAVGIPYWGAMQIYISDKWEEWKSQENPYVLVMTSKDEIKEIFVHPKAMQQMSDNGILQFIQK